MTDADGAFERLGGTAPLLLLCDHASGALPAAYGTLGLPPHLLDTHIAYDIGAAHMTRALAAAFDAPAILGRYSRLLIDLNRGTDDPTLVMKLSDGSIIPGNRDAGAAEMARRVALFHAPYHEAITAEIQRIQARLPLCAQRMEGEVAVARRPLSLAHRARERPRRAKAGGGRQTDNDRLGAPALVSIHSFTPAWKGRARPWEVGVLWDRDGRLARPLMAGLSAAGFAVGDNEPYSGALENDTLNRHGTKTGLPHVLIEVRQDLVGDRMAAEAFARRLEPILAAALARMEAGE